MNHRLIVIATALCFCTLLRAGDAPRAPFDPAPLMKKLADARKEDKFNFVVVGDSKLAPAFTERVLPAIRKLNPDFVLSTGDLVPAGGGKKGEENWPKLTETLGPEMAARPWWPTIGNHELGGSHGAGPTGFDAFKHYYNLPEVYYSFEFRNAVFIALPFPQPVGEEVKWLEEKLKAAREADKLIFVFNHCPYYTVGTKTTDEVPNHATAITALFEKYHVAAVFSGHDHIYYRTVRQIPYVISAGAGAAIYHLRRREEALPEDVYYGALPVADATDKEKYVLVNGLKHATTKTPEADHFFCVVNVNGRNAVMKTQNAAGDLWDEWVLSSEKK